MHQGGFWGPRVWDWAPILGPEHSAELWVSGPRSRGSGQGALRGNQGPP